jgi:hypothetical protein
LEFFREFQSLFIRARFGKGEENARKGKVMKRKTVKCYFSVKGTVATISRKGNETTSSVHVAYLLDTMREINALYKKDGIAVLWEEK